MKLGFIFDVRFTKYQNEYYSVNLTQEFWNKRYLKFADSIVVVGRYVESNVNPSGRLVRSDNEQVEFKCIPAYGNLKRIFNQAAEEKAIEAAIRDCDAVVCRGWWGVNVCKKLNKPYMIEVISCVWDSFWNHGALGKLMAVPNFIKQRKAIKNSPYTLYVTNEFLQSRYPTNGVSVGVSDVMLNENDSDDVLENRLTRINTPKDKLIIGTAAALNVKYKGQRFVIKALAKLKKQGFSNFEYQLIGGGDSSALAALAKKLGVDDQVKIIGSLPHEKVFDWLDTIDIYVQPSLQEGLPRSVVEAMSRALPCVCARTGGMPELIDEKYICNKGVRFSDNLAKAILEISSHENMLNSAKKNYNESQNYNSSILGAKRDEFYKNFANAIIK